MKFEEILPYLKKGKKAYRKSENQLEYTANYVYFDFESNEILIRYSHSSHNVPSYVDFNDLVADDWEVLEQGIGGDYD